MLLENIFLNNEDLFFNPEARITEKNRSHSKTTHSNCENSLYVTPLVISSPIYDTPRYPPITADAISLRRNTPPPLPRKNDERILQTHVK